MTNNIIVVWRLDNEFTVTSVDRPPNPDHLSTKEWVILAAHTEHNDDNDTLEFSLTYIDTRGFELLLVCEEPEKFYF